MPCSMIRREQLVGWDLREAAIVAALMGIAALRACLPATPTCYRLRKRQARPIGPSRGLLEVPSVTPRGVLCQRFPDTVAFGLQVHGGPPVWIDPRAEQHPLLDIRRFHVRQCGHLHHLDTCAKM